MFFLKFLEVKSKTWFFGAHAAVSSFSSCHFLLAILGEIWYNMGHDEEKKFYSVVNGV